MEELNCTLAEVEGVKAVRGEGRPNVFAQRGIIGTNKGYLLGYAYTQAGERTEQDCSVLVTKGVDACGTIRTPQGGLDQRKSSREREVEWQDVQADPRVLRDRRTHSFQPLCERFCLYRII